VHDEHFPQKHPRGSSPSPKDSVTRPNDSLPEYFWEQREKWTAEAFLTPPTKEVKNNKVVDK
jgi:hypothetical protein